MVKKRKLLSQEQKDTAVKLYEQGNLTIKELAKKFNVPYSSLRNYITNKKSPVQNKVKVTGDKAYKFKNFAAEEWKKIKLPTNYKYEISNFGRLKSYGLDGIPYLINGSSKMGYQTFAYTDIETGKRTSQFVHRLVASYFIKNTSANNKVVMHIDGNKANNRVNNLKWASLVEAGKHGNEQKLKNEKANGKSTRSAGVKLTLAKVEMIRKILADPNRKTRMKMIAKQFGISEMTLYRIQNGDLWGNKGTGAVKEKSAPKLLADDVVKMIKKMLKEGKHSQAEIARITGISETVISRIKQGKTYASIR